MLLKEISHILGEVQPFISASFLNTSEGKLRDTALKAANSLFKATVNSRPLGIISAAEGPIVKIDVWMSNKELGESWASAVNSAVKQIFFNPVARKIEWRITSSNKDMLKVAESYGFRKEEELQGEGLNREALIVMGLPRTWSVSLSAANATAAEIAEKDEAVRKLEAKTKGLENTLKTANAELVEKNKTIGELLREKHDLQKQLESMQTKLNDTEDDKDFKETEIISALKQRVNKLEAALHQYDKESTELKMLVGEKIQHIANQAKIIEELQKAADPVGPKEKIIMEDPKKTEIKPKESIGENLLAPEKKIVRDKIKNLLTECGRIAKTNQNRLDKLIRVVEFTIATEKTTKEELQEKIDCSPATIEILLKILKDAEVIASRRENIGGKSIAVIQLTEAVIQKLNAGNKPQEEKTEEAARQEAEEIVIVEETPKPVEVKTEVISETPLKTETDETEDESEISQKAEEAIGIINSRDISLTKGISLKDLCKRIAMDPRSEDCTQLLQLIGNKYHIMGNPETPKHCFIKPKIFLTGMANNDGCRKTVANIVTENGLGQIHAQLLIRLRDAGGSLARADFNGNDPELAELKEKKIITMEGEVVKLLIPI